MYIVTMNHPETGERVRYSKHASESQAAGVVEAINTMQPLAAASYRKEA